MAREKCPACHQKVAPGSIQDHPIIPAEVTRAGGIGQPQTFRLCEDCRRALASWYTARVHHSDFDPATRRFRPKSSLELVKEYQQVFASFLEVRRRLARTGRRR